MLNIFIDLKISYDAYTFQTVNILFDSMYLAIIGVIRRTFYMQLNKLLVTYCTGVLY